MKRTINIVMMLSVSITIFAQQPKKTTTVKRAETKYNEAVKTKQYIVQVESNSLAQESLKELNDTSLNDSEREIYINNYRHSLRNGNPNSKKKSYDLTQEENNKEILDLSKSPKLNKRAKQTCIAMYERMTKDK